MRGRLGAIEEVLPLVRPMWTAVVCSCASAISSSVSDASALRWAVVAALGARPCATARSARASSFSAAVTSWACWSIACCSGPSPFYRHG